MDEGQPNNQLRLLYTLLCDDVRLEVGNRLTLVGLFQNLMVQQFPATLIKLAILQHWAGDGAYLSELRILTPDRQQPVVLSTPTRIELAPGGFADNVTFFGNVVFPAPGQYWVQTLVNSTLFDEQPLLVVDLRSIQQGPDAASEAVN